MINKEKYLVYDPKKDILKLNETENELIGHLIRSPEFKYDRIIREYFNKSRSKPEFLERIDEIFSYYYKPSPDKVSVGGMFNLTKAWEIVEKLNGENQSRIVERADKREYTVKQVAFYLYCKDAFFEQGQKTKQIKAIAQEKNLKGYKDLLTQFTNLSKAGTQGETNRNKFLVLQENQNAVMKMLKSDNDKKAILKLTQSINNLPISP